jgi:hypothetical protein
MKLQSKFPNLRLKETCTLYHSIPHCTATNGIPQDKYRKSIASIIFEKNGNEYQEKNAFCSIIKPI